MALTRGPQRSPVTSIRGPLAARLVVGTLALAGADLQADQQKPVLPLSAEQRVAIARAFAPVLVFHPLEQYFPVSPRVRLGAGADRTSAAVLEGWSTRVAGYRALSVDERLRRTSLGYRVFSRVARGQTEVVVEYWSYYVYNQFTIRGTWLPYRIPDNHPHDLERLYLILTAAEGARVNGDASDDAWARRSFVIRSVVANAHAGSIPPNHYDAAEGELLSWPLHVLVERGSHAMAPDIDRDGRFTPGIDSTATPKLQWGIRDHGATASRYRPSFMDNRDRSAIRLCGPTQANPEEADSCPRYELYATDELQSWFQRLDLSDTDRDSVFGRSSWLVRTFGDVRLENLLVPSDPADGSVLAQMERRRIRGQTGHFVGLTAAGRSPIAIFGQRYFWNLAPRRAPDVAVEGVVLFSSDRRPLTEGTLWASYTVDAMTNVVFGGGWYSERRTADIGAGVDLRLGRFTVRQLWRSHSRTFNARVTTRF
jgi:hypothetical protein